MSMPTLELCRAWDGDWPTMVAVHHKGDAVNKAEYVMRRFCYVDDSMMRRGVIHACDIDFDLTCGHTFTGAIPPNYCHVCGCEVVRNDEP